MFHNKTVIDYVVLVLQLCPMHLYLLSRQKYIIEERIFLYNFIELTLILWLVPAYYLPQNAGDIARKYIKDPNLLSFIDAEVSIGLAPSMWSSVTIFA